MMPAKNQYINIYIYVYKYIQDFLYAVFNQNHFTYLGSFKGVFVSLI